MKFNLFILAFLFSINSVFGQIKRDNLFKKLNIVLINSSDIVISNGIFNMEDSKSSMTFLNDSGFTIENRISSIRENHGIIYNFKYGNCESYEYFEWLDSKAGKVDTIQKQKILFDNNCRIKEIIWLDTLGNITQKRNCEYNKQGKIISEIDRDNKGELTSSVSYFYPNEFTIEKKAFLGSDKFWYHTQERCDKRGNQIEYMNFDKNGKSTNEGHKTEYIYKEEKLLEKTEFNSESKITSRIIYSYNSDGLVNRTVRNTFEEDGETEIISVIKYIKRR